MKIRPLPDTDLARFALLEREEKRLRLKKFHLGRPSHSWAPLRAAESAIFDARKSLFDLPRSAWADIEAAIARSCRNNPDWFEANIERAKLLFEFNRSRSVTAVEQAFGAVPIGFGAKLKVWSDFYTIQGDTPVVSFCDPRRGHGLTRLGRQFVFSAMKHNVGFGDFGEAKFEIFQFTNAKDESPSVRVFKMETDTIIDFETMNSKVQETYEIWAEILAEREEEAKRAEPKKAVGGLFD